jgi:hypothetical protein
MPRSKGRNFVRGGLSGLGQFGQDDEEFKLTRPCETGAKKAAAAAKKAAAAARKDRTKMLEKAADEKKDRETATVSEDHWEKQRQASLAKQAKEQKDRKASAEHRKVCEASGTVVTLTTRLPIQSGSIKVVKIPQRSPSLPDFDEEAAATIAAASIECCFGKAHDDTTDCDSEVLTLTPADKKKAIKALQKQKRSLKSLAKSGGSRVKRMTTEEAIDALAEVNSKLGDLECD